MTNLEDLKLCISSDDEDYIADWLIDFAYYVSNYIVSDAEIFEYLNHDRIEWQPPKLPQKPASQRRINDSLHRKHTENIWNANSNRFYHPFGYFPVDEDGRYTDNKDEVAYYKRFTWKPGRKKWMKRRSNKKLRRSDPDVAYRGGKYKRIFNYYWQQLC